MKNLFLALVMFNSISLMADENPVSLERPAGKVECNHEVQRCLYISQNVTANDLMIKLNASAFMNGAISPNWF